jgi:hypothetical protein
MLLVLPGGAGLTLWARESQVVQQQEPGEPVALRRGQAQILFKCGLAWAEGEGAASLPLTQRVPAARVVPTTTSADKLRAVQLALRVSPGGMGTPLDRRPQYVGPPGAAAVGDQLLPQRVETAGRELSQAAVVGAVGRH